MPHEHDSGTPPTQNVVRPEFILRRTGEVASFEPERIRDAILKAGTATGQFDRLMADSLTRRVLEQIEAKFHGHTPSVEQVQDIVEDVLIRSPFTRTAKAYILYRSQHAKIRELASRSNVQLMRRYLDRDGWAVRENSNMAYSLQGLNNFVSSEVTQQYWLEEIYPPEIRDVHRSGDFHIHDLGLLAPYCVGWDLIDLLRRGFRGVPGKVATAPARHFGSALGQIVNFFYTLQGEAAGAQAFSHFDTLLSPFLRYDELDYPQVKQALQSFVFNLNVPTRVGFSTPFTNLTFDLTPPGHLKDVAVVVGGLTQDTKYGDYQREMDLINAAFLDVMAEGDADGRVFTFPIPTYNITPDFDWDNDAWSELWEVTAKYGIPYFANFIGSDMSPEESRSMCCRLRLDLAELRRRGGGLFGSNPLTGSIGVVTLNMPRIGYLAHDEADFLARVDRLMELARDSLEIKRKVLERFTENDLYPYAKSYLEGVSSRFGEYWHNHFSTIGLVGMNEACLNFLGQDIGNREGSALAARVLDHMRARLAEFQEATGHVYNLEATPAEGTSYRLARIDQREYPHFKTATSSAEIPCYTNSTQLPVGYSDDIFRVLELQDHLQAKYTGGTVQHVFLGEAAADPEAVKAFVRKVCENYRLPYLTITPTFSICPLHGYLPGEQPRCPQCKGKVEVYSRVVGYLRPVDQWNDGKQAEFRNRATYAIARGER